MSENIEQRTSKKSGLIQLILVTLFIAGSIFLSKMLELSYEPPVKNDGKARILYVNTQKIKNKDYRIEFNTTGIIRPKNKINITPQVSGQIIWVNDSFSEGGFFDEDEILFKIDPQDYILKTKQAKSEIAKASTELKIEEARSNSAIAEWQEFNAKKEIPDLVARKPYVKQARAALESAKANYEKALLDLRRTKYSLPFSGRVINSDISLGTFVNSNQNYAQIYNSDSLEIKLSLNSKQRKWILQAQNPEIEALIKKDEQEIKLKAYIKRIPSIINDKTRFADIYLGFIESNKQNKIEQILPGDFVYVKLKGEILHNVAIVPSQAMQGNEMIFVVDKNNKLKQVEQKAIFRTDDYIILKNLKDGTKIVIDKINGASEGMKVEGIK